MLGLKLRGLFQGRRLLSLSVTWEGVDKERRDKEKMSIACEYKSNEFQREKVMTQPSVYKACDEKSAKYRDLWDNQGFYQSKWTEDKTSLLNEDSLHLL